MKAQSAVEYLMTYGWMLLVVAIAGGAVFSIVNSQSIENVSGFTSKEVTVSDFGMTGSGLAMSLQGQSSETVEVEEVFISNSEGSNATVPLRTQVGLGESSNLHLPYVTSSDGADAVNIELKYGAGKLSNITALGTITGQLKFDESFVGYWTLSKTQGNQTHVYDISQNQNHGELNGSKYVETELGNAVQFDGVNDKIELSGDRGSGKTDDFTVSAWIKTEDSGWVFGEGAVFRVYMDPGNNARFWIRDEGFGESNTVAGGNIKADTWHHITGVYDSSSGEQALYVDGEQAAAESPNFEGIGNNHDNLCIGESWCGSGDFFNGTISDVRIFNRALSEREIQGAYNTHGVIQ